jgi:hypothetical protein
MFKMTHKALRILPALGLAFLLSGCLSIDERLSLNADASGRIAFQSKLSPPAASEIGSLPAFLSGPGLQRRTDQLNNGDVVRTEVLEFRRLADAQLGEGLYIEPAPGGAVMVRTHGHDPSLAKSLDKLRLPLTGETYRFGFEAAGGQIVDAPHVSVNGRNYIPDLVGSQVIWTVPMVQLMEHISRSDLVFRARFRH